MAQEIYHRSEWGNPTETWGNVYLNADLTNELYKRASEYENSWVTDQLLNGVGIKPSIILTPTAYEDGVLNSVKPAKTFGSELVIGTNSDMSGANNWVSGIGSLDFNINTTVAEKMWCNFTSGNQQTKLLNVLTIGKTYLVSLTARLNSGTSTTVQIGGFTSTQSSPSVFNITPTSTETTYTGYIIADKVDLSIGIILANNNGSNYEFDNVSVKEVIDADFDFTRGSSATRVNELGLVSDVQILSGELVQNGDFEQIGSELVTNGGFDTDSDWSKGTGCTIENGKAKYTNALSGQGFTQSNFLTIGKFYKITFTVSDYSQGSVKIRYPFNMSNTITANGTYTEYGEAITDDLFLQNVGTTTLSIDNVSVKEVGQNWTFFGEAEFTDNGARIYSSDGSNSYIGQLSILTNTKKYRLSYEITDSTTGSLKLINVNGLSSIPITSTVGTHTLDFTANNNNFYILRNSGATDVTIDNISVVEVTDDTDLPRINYTNFDYEDVLGDELVTNGTFDTDSNWSFDNVGGTKGWRIADNRAICDISGASNGRNLQQYLDISITSGKKYKVSLDILQSQDNILLFIGGQTVTLPTGTNLGYETTFVASSTSTLITFFASTSDTQEIDNVSVKELTEDVVVPYSGEGSLLLEPQSTNLITYSEDFSEWSPTNIVLTEDVVISPDGTTTADKIAGTSITSQHRVNFTSTNVSGATTFSFFAKSGEYTSCWARIGFSNAYFDLENGLTSEGSGITSSIENYGNGWYRCIMTKASSSANEVCRINITTSYLDTSDFLGDSTSGIYLWGAQHEQLSYATSYIPTNGEVNGVTRLADICNNSGNSDLINSTSGVLYAEISALANDGSSRTIALNKDSNDRIQMYFDTTDNVLSIFYKAQGTHIFGMSETLDDATEFNKIAFKWKTNDFALWVNGTETDTVSSGVTSNANTLNALEFEMFNDFAPFYGNVKCLAVFKEALSDTELQKLTTI